VTVPLLWMMSAPRLTIAMDQTGKVVFRGDFVGRLLALLVRNTTAGALSEKPPLLPLDPQGNEGLSLESREAGLGEQAAALPLSPALVAEQASELNPVGVQRGAFSSAVGQPPGSPVSEEAAPGPVPAEIRLEKPHPLSALNRRLISAEPENPAGEGQVRLQVRATSGVTVSAEARRAVTAGVVEQPVVVARERTVSTSVSSAGVVEQPVVTVRELLRDKQAVTERRQAAQSAVSDRQAPVPGRPVVSATTSRDLGAVVPDRPATVSGGRAAESYPGLSAVIREGMPGQQANSIPAEVSRGGTRAGTQPVPSGEPGSGRRLAPNANLVTGIMSGSLTREGASSIGQSSGAAVSSPAAAVYNPVRPEPPPPVAQQLAEVVTAQVRANLAETGQPVRVQIALEPPHLGKVTLDLTFGSDGLEAKFYTPDRLVKSVIEQALPQLREALIRQEIGLGNALVFLGHGNTGEQPARLFRGSWTWHPEPEEPDSQPGLDVVRLAGNPERGGVNCLV